MAEDEWRMMMMMMMMKMKMRMMRTTTTTPVVMMLMLDVDCWLLIVRGWFLVLGSRFLVVGCWLLVVEGVGFWWGCFWCSWWPWRWWWSLLSSLSSSSCSSSSSFWSSSWWWSWLSFTWDSLSFQETYEYAVALKAATKPGRLELFKARFGKMSNMPGMRGWTVRYELYHIFVWSCFSWVWVSHVYLWSACD